jgi:hypothetical protein
VGALAVPDDKASLPYVIALELPFVAALWPGFVATVRGVVGSRASVAVADKLGIGVEVASGNAIGLGVGTVGEAPKAAGVSTAPRTKLNRTATAARATRNDVIPYLLALSAYADALPHAADRTPTCPGR